MSYWRNAKRAWTGQPPGPTRIDRTNPITRGLFFASHGGAQNRNLVDGVLPTVSGASVNFDAWQKSGRATRFGSTGYHEYSSADQLIFGNGYTVLSVARTTSLAAQSGLVAKWNTPTGDNVPMTFFVRSSGELALWRNVGGTNNGTVGTTTTMGGTTGQSVISTNQEFVASVDAGPTVLSLPNLYLNGALRNSGWTFGPSGSDVALSEPSGSKVAVGASNGGTNTWQGNIYLTLCWNRRLTPAEHVSLHKNPWQVFEFLPRTIFTTADAGLNAHTYTGSGGFTLSGTAPLTRNRSAIPSGGAVFAGTAPRARNRSVTPSGGIVFAGAAPTESGTAGLNSYTYTGSGGFVLAGAATTARTANREYTPSGGISFAGAAALLRNRSFLPSGGITFGGAASTISPAGPAVSNGTPNPMLKYAGRMMNR